MSELQIETETLIEQIRQGPSGPEIAAVFDFDGTLIDGFSAAALYEHRLRSFEIGPDELVRTVRAALGPTLSEAQFTELIESGIQGWAGRTEDDLLELGERLFAQGVAGNLFHQAWRLVKAHQKQGHTVLIATSATELQVAPLARELGVEHVLCTRLATEGGVLTGAVEGRPPWGDGKVAAVEGFAEEHGLDLAFSHGYANGDEDLPLLEAVGHPHPVNPSDELAAIAAERGWPVLRFRRVPDRFDPRPAIRTAAMYGTLLGTAGAGILAGALNNDRRLGVDLATTLFGNLAGVIGNIDFEIIGEENAWAARPAVFFINHQSTLIEYLVTSRVIRSGFTVVAKAEVKQMPVIGQLFSMAGVAFLDRANREKAIEALRPAVEKLRSGTSVVMAPEGTRSLTPKLGRFKKGGFHMAVQAGVPIVPVVIRNAGEIMWRGAKTARTGTIQVVVHPPVPTAGWTIADIDRARDEMQRLYQDTLDDWPGTAGATGTVAAVTR
ncbi:MAG TPA: HAD-IB family hydrolase [Pseudonocardia sp.]|nr:HAD-IB family hydrolase [Pseudonocardia sp.]